MSRLGRRWRSSRLAHAAALLGAACSTLAAPAAHAESLEQAWREAASADPLLAAAASRVAAAQAQVDVARAERRPQASVGIDALELNRTPTFDFSAAGLPLTLPLFDDSRVVAATATLTVPVYTFGRTGALIGSAEAGVDAARSAAEALAGRVRLAVAERYVAVLRAESALRVADGHVASLAAHLTEVEDLYEGGSVPRNEFLAASVSLADAEQRRLQARHALEVAGAAYNRALGRPLTAPVDLDTALPGIDPRIETGDLSSLTAMAAAQRAEPQQLAAAAAATTKQSAAAAAARRPQLALTGGYARLGNEFLADDDYWMLGLGVRWNAFDGGRTRGRTAALELEVTALEREREDLDTRIALEVTQAYLARLEAEQRIDVTRRAVEQAEENLRVAQDRYRNGEGTHTDVLDAEALRHLSLGNFDAARYDAALARYRLAYAAGVL